MTLVEGYKHGYLRQVNVGVEIINKPERTGMYVRCREEMRRGARLCSHSMTAALEGVGVS